MKLKVFTLALMAALATGCSTLSKVNDDGSPQGALAWPQLSDEMVEQREHGSIGDMARIALLRSGATRDDVYELIGRPHFAEGFHVREWDYAFYFMDEDGSEQVCQFKVLYDDDLRARHFYWHTPDVNKTMPCPPTQNVTLSTDALFRFDGGSIRDLLPEGRASLDTLAAKLKDDTQITAIAVHGYTDRIGTDAYNLSLSRERAQSVRSYLISRGVRSSLISAEGYGEANPVKTCSASLDGKALIACLQPNRRVEVKIDR